MLTIEYFDAKNDEAMIQQVVQDSATETKPGHISMPATIGCITPEAAGKSITAVSSSPFLDNLRTNSLEDMHLVDPVDDYAMQQLKKLDDEKLKSSQEEVSEAEPSPSSCDSFESP